MNLVEIFPSLTLSLLLFGLVVVVRTRGAAARKLGRPLSADLAPRRPRNLALVGVAAAALAVLFGTEFETLEFTLLLLVPAALLIQLYPALDRVCGDQGVVLGWEARTFAEFEEWRVTGEHLRFKTDGEWKAVPAPVEGRAALRELLLAAAPDRESPFRH